MLGVLKNYIIYILHYLLLHYLLYNITEPVYKTEEGPHQPTISNVHIEKGGFNPWACQYKGDRNFFSGFYIQGLFFWQFYNILANVSISGLISEKECNASWTIIGIILTV